VAATGLASPGDRRSQRDGASETGSKRLLASYTLSQPRGPRIDTKWFGARTTISWSTGSGHAGSLYVASAGKPERLIARGSRGSELVRWIVPDVRYLFRLYAGSSKKDLLASHTLSQPTGPRMEARWFGVSTAISWSTGGSRTGSLYVSAAGKRERLFGRGRVGSQRVGWIAPGVRYVFHLYAGFSKKRLLASSTVLLPKRARIDAKWFGSSTAISWSTGGRRTGSLYVAAAGKRERLFGRGRVGSQRVRWIAPGVRYVFRLYVS
jgi:hypothetical protein